MEETSIHFLGPVTFLNGCPSRAKNEKRPTWPLYLGELLVFNFVNHVFYRWSGCSVRQDDSFHGGIWSCHCICHAMPGFYNTPGKISKHGKTLQKSIGNTRCGHRTYHIACDTLFLIEENLYGVVGMAIWFLVGVVYFAAYGRHRLVFSPEEQFALNQITE